MRGILYLIFTNCIFVPIYKNLKTRSHVHRAFCDILIIDNINSEKGIPDVSTKLKFIHWIMKETSLNYFVFDHYILF